MSQRQLIEQLATSDQGLRDARDRAARYVRLTTDLLLERVVAHDDSPKKHPLPANPKSAERLLATLVDSLGVVKKRKLKNAVQNRIASNRNAHYGDLAGIALDSAVPVLDQVRDHVKQSVAPFPAAERARLSKLLSDTLRRPLKKASPRAALPTKLVLELTEAECVEKTREFAEGKDEIELLISAVTEALAFDLQAVSTVVLDLGKFKDKEKKPVSTQLASFDLAANAVFPQGFRAIVIVAEKDAINPLSRRGQIAETIILLIAMLIAFFVYYILPSIIGISLATEGWLIFAAVIAGIALGSVFFLISWLIDDLFVPEDVILFLDGFGDPLPIDDVVTCSRGPGFLGLVEDKRGRYKLTMQWKFA